MSSVSRSLDSDKGRPTAPALTRFSDRVFGRVWVAPFGDDVGEAELIRTSERGSSSSAFLFRLDGFENGTVVTDFSSVKSIINLDYVLVSLEL